jgi:hypothetical protein
VGLSSSKGAVIAGVLEAAVIARVLGPGERYLVHRGGRLVLYEALDDRRPATRLFATECKSRPGEATIAVTDQRVLVLCPSERTRATLALSLSFSDITAIATGYSRSPGQRWPALEFHGPNEVAVVRLPAASLTDLASAITAHAIVPVLPARALARPTAAGDAQARLHRWFPADGQTAEFRWNADADLVLVAGTLEVGRLHSLGTVNFPLERWWVQTEAGSWQVDAEGTRRDWSFVVRSVRGDEVAASARRHRWRLGRFDLWLSPGHAYRLAWHAVGCTEVTDSAGERVATVDWLSRNREPAGTITIWRAPESAVELALLLLLTLRVSLFQTYTGRMGGGWQPMRNQWNAARWRLG